MDKCRVCTIGNMKISIPEDAYGNDLITVYVCDNKDCGAYCEVKYPIGGKGSRKKWIVNGQTVYPE